MDIAAHMLTVLHNAGKPLKKGQVIDISGNEFIYKRKKLRYFKANYESAWNILVKSRWLHEEVSIKKASVKKEIWYSDLEYNWKTWKDFDHMVIRMVEMVLN